MEPYHSNSGISIILDQAFGSSGKGKISTAVSMLYKISHISSANFPNAGHTAVFANGQKFVAKALPTAAILNRVEPRVQRTFYITPGSGYSMRQLFDEWVQCGFPRVVIHEMASIVTEDHARREVEGPGSTTHIASTRQGSSAAIVDKVLRKFDCALAGNTWPSFVQLCEHWLKDIKEPKSRLNNLIIADGATFRDMVIDTSEQYAWLHEGSQGYALSLDHGAAPFYGTSRNCTAAAAIDYLGAPPQSVNDVWLNIRTFPIRVGHITDDSGNVVGHSGPFYADQEELTWDDVARISGMPADEAALLRERERTTVTKRVRRVATFSWIGLRDAARTNGATKLSVNFVQYLNWSDFQKRGVGEDAYNSLSAETRAFIKKVEETANAKVHLIGTGPLNEDLIVR